MFNCEYGQRRLSSDCQGWNCVILSSRRIPFTLAQPRAHRGILKLRFAVGRRSRFVFSSVPGSRIGKITTWYPPSPLPPRLWNHRLSGKSQNNLWAVTTYGQNLESQGVRARCVIPDSRRLLGIGISQSRLDEHWRLWKTGFCNWATLRRFSAERCQGGTVLTRETQ
jgi:hypothetical protein